MIKLNHFSIKLESTISLLNIPYNFLRKLGKNSLLFLEFHSPASMVRHNDASSTMVDSLSRLSGRQHPLDNDGKSGLVNQPSHLLPAAFLIVRTSVCHVGWVVHTAGEVHWVLL